MILHYNGLKAIYRIKCRVVLEGQSSEFMGKFYVSVINPGFSIRPLLFLICINDIIDGLESTPLFMLMTLLYLRS